ncbi:MAG: hypothetical protein IK065_04795 [Neisseriaceae bacterium]|nr:hypothetical protein [Neisseriaceae bacterium]
MCFPAHQNTAGVNQLYFNNFLSNPIGRLVGKDAHPTAFLFQKLGFARVSDSVISPSGQQVCTLQSISPC